MPNVAGDGMTMMCVTHASVSTLLTTVGLRNAPSTAEYSTMSGTETVFMNAIA